MHAVLLTLLNVVGIANGLGNREDAALGHLSSRHVHTVSPSGNPSPAILRYGYSVYRNSVIGASRCRRRIDKPRRRPRRRFIIFRSEALAGFLGAGASVRSDLGCWQKASPDKVIILGVRADPEPLHPVLYRNTERTI